MQGEKPQQSIVKETKRIGVGTVIMLVVMLAIYAVLGKFTVGVLLGGLLGSAYAIFNFFMLGMTLQKAASMTDQQMAHMKVRSSYSTRMIGMLILAVVAFALPFVEGIPCLIALLFPRATIFVLQVTGQIKDV
ncbi:MAG: ATP synthase subunit I [Christensenellales bacterium]|nr:ATP synthase subunit I [Christensenellales bacterium]